MDDTAGRHSDAPANNVVGYALLTFAFHKEGRYWVGECLELGTATDGPSLEKVDKDLAKLVSLHIEGLHGVGEREQIFRERGIAVYTDVIPRAVPGQIPVAGDIATVVHMRPVPVRNPSSWAISA